MKILAVDHDKFNTVYCRSWNSVMLLQFTRCFRRMSRPMTWMCCVAVVFLAVGCSQPRAKIPTSYANYNDKDAAFSIDYPEGWTAEGGVAEFDEIRWVRATCCSSPGEQ